MSRILIPATREGPTDTVSSSGRFWVKARIVKGTRQLPQIVVDTDPTDRKSVKIDMLKMRFVMT